MVIVTYVKSLKNRDTGSKRGMEMENSMKVFFTEIFALYKKNKKFFLINKKLDTIIPIEETLYFMLNQIILNGEMDINAIRIRADTLDILLYNRILGVKN